MFEFSPTATYSMPAHFGGVEGAPRSWTYAEVRSVAIEYRTDPAVERYVPDRFELTRPVIQVNYAMNAGVEWMAGGNYNLVAVNVPVAYRDGSEALEGWFALVVWESKACPILGGREQTGIPKIFADVEDLHQLEDRVFGNVSYEGSSFLRVEARKTGAMTADDLEALNREAGNLNWFGWRYIPNTGRAGAALSHPTLYPIESDFVAGWRAEAGVEWRALTWEQNPTQAHIIEALSSLPIESYGDCRITRGTQTLRVDTARDLS